jgi:uncharacterized protein YqgV (UPF0045/DUF77 family)
MATNITVEFTIEPFVDGALPPYVSAALTALQALGLSVEIGPFGSSFVVSTDLAGEAIGALVNAAYGNGATHVSIHAGGDA